VVSIAHEKYRKEKGFGVAESEGWVEALFLDAWQGFVILAVGIR
jgi:hypothetical protein